MQFPSDDEAPPLLLVVRGDRETWRILFLQYNEPLCRFISFLGVKEEEDIRDLSADTWRKSWESKTKAKPDFRAWLFKIAKYTTIDFLRKRSRRGKNMSLEPEDDALPEGMWHADPEDLVQLSGNSAGAYWREGPL